MLNRIVRRPSLRAVAFALCAVTAVSTAGVPAPALALRATPAPMPAQVDVPPGELIPVEIQQDIGSRISADGDTFAVVTLEDYVVGGVLVLPKGSPGYGSVTSVKRAGYLRHGGQMTFTVERLVAPDGTSIAVTTNGATADADSKTERNGGTFNAVALAVLCKLCVIARRGNDMLVKTGTVFHVVTTQQTHVRGVAPAATPAPIDTQLVHHA